MGGFNVGLRLVGIGDARLRQLVQRPAEGGANERGAPARADRRDAFECLRQWLVELNYELSYHIESICRVYCK